MGPIAGRNGCSENVVLSAIGSILIGIEPNLFSIKSYELYEFLKHIFGIIKMELKVYSVILNK
jgi:hypothetical protein